MTNVIENIKFAFNGIRNGRDLVCKGWFSYQKATTICGREVAEHVTFYADSYRASIPSEVRELVTVENDTDSMTDYFEKDRFVMEAGHPLFKAALTAACKEADRRVARLAKRAAKATGYNAEYYTMELNNYTAQADEMRARLADCADGESVEDCLARKARAKRQAEMEKKSEEIARRRKAAAERFEAERDAKRLAANPAEGVKVRFVWSESNVIADGLVVSVADAEAMIKKATDAINNEPGGRLGHDKTKFEILVAGESVYAGRYDVGCSGECGSLIGHIEEYITYLAKQDSVNLNDVREGRELIATLKAAC